MTALAPTLQAFFTDRLIGQRQASPHTIAAYRDTLRLMLVFASALRRTEPSKLQIDDLDAPLVGAFLDHLERRPLGPEHQPVPHLCGRILKGNLDCLIAEPFDLYDLGQPPGRKPPDARTSLQVFKTRHLLRRRAPSLASGADWHSPSKRD